MSTPVTPKDISLPTSTIGAVVLAKKTAGAGPVSAFTALLSASVPSKKRTSEEIAAENVIMSAREAATGFKWSQFAYQLGRDQVGMMGAPYDFIGGGQSYNSLTAYIDQLKYLKSRKEPFFAFGKKDALIDGSIVILEQSKRVLQHAPHAIFGAQENEVIEKAVTAMKKEIDTELKARGYIYFPTGYVTRTPGEAHAVGCKITQDKNETTVWILNLGAGADMHPHLDVTDKCYIESTAYYPVTIPNAVWEKKANAFLYHLTRLKTDTPFAGSSDHDCKDLYALLATLGPFNTRLIEAKAKQLHGKYQRVGDCSEKAVKLEWTHFLQFEGEAKAEDIDRLLLNTDLTALFGAYHAYQKENTPKGRRLLIYGAKKLEHKLSHLKENNLITEQEFNETENIVHYILEQAKEVPDEPAATPQNTLVSTKFTKVNHPKGWNSRIDHAHTDHKLNRSLVLFSKFNPRRFKSDLLDFRARLEEVYQYQWQISKFHAIMQLPIPKWNDPNDPWNAVPVEDITGILDCLRHQAHDTAMMINSSASRFFSQYEWTLFTCKLYCIGDKLARRLNHTKLAGFATPFPIPSDVENFFLGANANFDNQYVAMKAYFHSCAMAAPNKTIFPFNCGLGIKRLVKKPKENLSSTELAHIAFVGQFNPNAKSDAEYGALFHLIPNEVKDLHYFYLTSVSSMNRGRLYSRLMYSQTSSYEELRNDDKNLTLYNDLSAPHFVLEQPPIVYRAFVMQERTTNQIITGEGERPTQRYKYSKNNDELAGISKPFARELVLLTRHPNLKVAKALMWMKTHPHLLHDEDVQSILENCFFSVGALEDSFKRSRADKIKSFRETMEGCLSCLQENEVGAIAFVIRMGTKFESYANDQKSKAIHADYKKRLQSLLESRTMGKSDMEDHETTLLLLHLIYFSTFEEQKSTEDFIEIYTHIFRLGLHPEALWRGDETSTPIPKAFQYLSFYLTTIAIRLQLFLESAKANKEVMQDRICNGIVKNLIKEVKEVRHWNFISSHIAISGDLKLDLQTGKIHHTGNENYELLQLQARFRRYYKVNENDKDYNKVWWHGYDCLFSFDQTMGVYDFRQGKVRWFTKKPEEKKLEFAVFDKDTEHRLPMIAAFAGKGDISHQIVKQNPNLLETTVVSSVSDGTPFAQTTFKGDEVSCVRTDSKGGLTTSVLANLETLPPNHPLYPYTLHVLPASQQLCFVKEGTNEIEELYYTSVGLSFKRKGKDLECDQHPGYFIVPTEIAELGHLSKKGVVLRNSQGKLKLILLDPIQAELPLGQEWVNGNPTFRGYCPYDLKSAKDPIPCKTVSQRLYLAYFFKMHGAYDTAFQHLQLCCQALNFDSQTLSILGFFTKIKDASAESLAFNMKLICFITDKFSHMKEEDQEFAKKILAYSTGWYREYLRVMQSVPAEMLLSEGEEIRLLSTYKREEIKLNNTLNLRLEIYSSKTRVVEVTFSPQKVALAPYIYYSVDPPEKLAGKFGNFFYHPQTPEANATKYPTRVNYSYVMKNFSSLFARAKKGDLNFDLLGLLQVKPEGNEEDSPNLGSAPIFVELLFYINFFPEKFADLELSGNHADQDTMNEVITRVATLPQTPDYAQRHAQIFNTAMFNYDHKRSVSLPKPPNVSALLPALPMANSRKPLEDISNALLTKKMVAAPSSDHVFDPRYFANATPHEKELMSRLEKANEALKNETRVVYAVKPDQIKTARDTLEQRKKELNAEVVDLETRIKNLLNDPYNHFPALASQKNKFQAFRLQLESGLKRTLTAEDVMREVILRNDASLFAIERPMFSAEMIRQITTLCNNYYHKQVLLAQKEEALELIQASKWQELGELLNYDFDYDAPEIDFMKVHGKKLPTPKQLEIFKWVCEGFEIGENRLFQFAAAGGKTTFLIPLFILHLQRYNLIPTVISTNAIFNDESENLGVILQQLGIKRTTIKFDLHKEIDLRSARMMLQDLNESLRKKDVLHITPEVFSAIRLHYYMAACDKRDDVAGILQRVLDLFKTKGVMICDESHRNVDPLTQSIFGSGNQGRLDERETNLLLELMKPVLGMKTVPGIKPILKESSAIAPTKNEMEVIQKNLATYISEMLLKQLPTHARGAFLRYWTERFVTELPPLPPKFSDEDRHLVRLTRYFVLDLLPQICKMRTDLDHVYSEEHDIDTPSHHKVPSKALFENPYFSWLISIKGLWHRGLNTKQLSTVFDTMQTRSTLQTPTSPSAQETPTQVLFRKWLGTHDKKVSVFQATSAKYGNLATHPGAVEYYLAHKMRTKIGFASEQLTSTPTHMVNGFKHGVFFSATPLPELAHPQSIKSTKLDPTFEAEVLAIGKKQNKFISPGSPSAFFADMKGRPEHYKNVRAIIDTGFLCDVDTETNAMNWLSNSELDGVLYYDDSRGGKFTLVLYVGGELRKFYLNGGSATLAKELFEEHNLVWDRFKIGTLFDVAHAESANIAQKDDAEAILCVGEHCTLAHLIQAMMRMRKLLDLQKNQKLIWAIPKELKDKMKIPGVEFGIDAVFAWVAKNQAKRVSSQTLLTTAQHISYTIEESTQTNVAKEKRIENIRKYRDGFNEKVIPSKRWVPATGLGECDQVLFAHADNVYKRYYGKTSALSSALKGQIQPAIQKVQNLHGKEKVTVAVDQNESGEMTQRCNVKAQVKAVNHPMSAPREYLAEAPVKTIALTSTQYVASLKEENSAKNVFKMPQLTEDFYVHPSFIRTAREKDKSLDSSFRKPIEFIVVTHCNGKNYAEVQSPDELSEAISSLRRPIHGVPHKVFVLGKNGEELERGTGNLAPSDELVKTIKESTWMQKVLGDAAFLNAELSTNKHFVEKQKNWPTFDKDYQTVCTAFPYKDPSAFNTLSDYHAFADPEAALALNFAF